MPWCDVVGPWDRPLAALLHIPRMTGMERACDRPTLNPKDRAMGKWPCLEARVTSSAVARAASAVVGSPHPPS